jgi:hypothetical protein
MNAFVKNEFDKKFLLKRASLVQNCSREQIVGCLGECSGVKIDSLLCFTKIFN